MGFVFKQKRFFGFHIYLYRANFLVYNQVHDFGVFSLVGHEMAIINGRMGTHRENIAILYWTKAGQWISPQNQILHCDSVVGTT